ncbi:hypothetical protein BT93_G1600 [Corymbia citriodora subsp. variegata]|nr:hypothetical protein BT93_G1600 [Corymbia citriodora subsp. variegata]
MALTEKQEVLVKESWEILQQNVPEYSIRFYQRIMEVAPEAKNLFSFLRDSDEIPRTTPTSKLTPRRSSSCLHLFFPFLGDFTYTVSSLCLTQTCESVIQLRERGAVTIEDSTMKHLGSLHLKIGVTDRHFDVVRDALLRTIEGAVGEKWSKEMEGAWGTGYDQLAAAIQAAMKDGAAATAN